MDGPICSIITIPNDSVLLLFIIISKYNGVTLDLDTFFKMVIKNASRTRGHNLVIIKLHCRSYMKINDPSAGSNRIDRYVMKTKRVKRKH